MQKQGNNSLSYKGPVLLLAAGIGLSACAQGTADRMQLATDKFFGTGDYLKVEKLYPQDFKKYLTDSAFGKLKYTTLKLELGNDNRVSLFDSGFTISGAEEASPSTTPKSLSYIDILPLQYFSIISFLKIAI
tara:strand:- start:250 stop:645 length:396 start_codon:yes stop_codon:yes gene_type:complete